MDDDDYKYAEFIFDFLKKRGRGIRKSNLSNAIHSMTQYKEWKELHNYDHIYRYLEDLGLIQIIIHTSNNHEIVLTELFHKTPSINSLVSDLKKEEEDKRRKEIQKEEDELLDRELKKRQLWQVKYWWVPALFTLILGAVIQRIFDIL